MLCVGAVALGCFISLDRPSGTGPRDGAVLHGTLAGLAFIAAAMLRPAMVHTEDFVLITGIVAMHMAPLVMKLARRGLRAAGHTAAVPADMVTVASALWAGAALTTGSVQAMVFVLLFAALGAMLKGRVAGCDSDVVQAPSRRVELHNTMAMLVEKLNGAHSVLREEEVMAPVLRMPLRLIESQPQIEPAPVTARRRDARVSTRTMPRRVVPAPRGQMLARA